MDRRRRFSPRGDNVFVCRYSVVLSCHVLSIHSIPFRFRFRSRFVYLFYGMRPIYLIPFHEFDYFEKNRWKNPHSLSSPFIASPPFLFPTPQIPPPSPLPPINPPPPLLITPPRRTNPHALIRNDLQIRHFLPLATSSRPSRLAHQAHQRLFLCPALLFRHVG